MGLEEIETGRSVILHTGRGPGDDRIERTVDRFKAKGFSDLDVKLKSGAILGEALGRILKGILESKSLKRVATTGGDTSYYVARALGIEALEVVASMAPGSPLCRVVAQPPQVNGVEMTFKGGQVGKVGFFEQVLNGF